MRKEIKHNTLTIIPGRSLDIAAAQEIRLSALSFQSLASNLIVDMKNVEYMSTAGLGSLIDTQKLYENRGEAYLSNVPDSIASLLKKTDMIKHLTIKKAEKPREMKTDDIFSTSLKDQIREAKENTAPVHQPKEDRHNEREASEIEEEMEEREYE